MSDKRCCENCRAYVPFVDGEGNEIYAECHFMPPSSQRVPSNRCPESWPTFHDIVTNWPQVKPNDWCCQFVECDAEGEGTKA